MIVNEMLNTELKQVAVLIVQYLPNSNFYDKNC